MTLLIPFSSLQRFFKALLFSFKARIFHLRIHCAKCFSKILKLTVIWWYPNLFLCLFLLIFALEFKSHCFCWPRQTSTGWLRPGLHFWFYNLAEAAEFLFTFIQSSKPVPKTSPAKQHFGSPAQVFYSFPQVPKSSAAFRHSNDVEYLSFAYGFKSTQDID